MEKLTLELDHLNLSVQNLADSIEWYERVFGFHKVEEGIRKGKKWAIIRKDDVMLCMYEDNRDFFDGDHLSTNKVHGFNHFALRVEDRSAWEKKLKDESIPVSLFWSYPHSDSWYVHDPTGYEIEVVHWDQEQVSFTGV